MRITIMLLLVYLSITTILIQAQIYLVPQCHALQTSPPLPSSLLLRWYIPHLQPTPNIQTNLTSTRNRQTRMPALRIPAPILPQVLPIHSIPCNRFENNAFFQPLIFVSCILTSALDELAPFVPHRPWQARKMRTATCAVRGKIHHETTHSAAVFGACAPVVVVRVVAAGAVSLSPEFFDENERFPALDAAGTLFDAFCCVISRQGCFVRVADFFVEDFLAGVPYC
jgi:hypothetical protein